MDISLTTSFIVCSLPPIAYIFMKLELSNWASLKYLLNLTNVIIGYIDFIISCAIV